MYIKCCCNLFGFGESVCEAFACKGEFAEFVTNHFFGDEDRHVVFAIVYEELQADKGWENGAASCFILRNRDQLITSAGKYCQSFLRARLTLRSNWCSFLDSLTETREGDKEGTLPCRAWHV